LKYIASVKFEHLQDIEDRFRAGGIPIYVRPDLVRSNEAAIVPAAIVSRHNLPAHWYRIDVCLDEQHEEAELLFANPDYEVRNRVDVDAFEETMNRLGANRPVSMRPPDRALNWLIGAILLAIVLAVVAAALTAGR